MYNEELTYKYINDVLSIPAKLLYDSWDVISYSYYKLLCHRGKLIRTKQGRGKGNTAWLSYYDLPDYIKDICIAKLGNPKEVKLRNDLEQYILPDPKASQFFASHRTPSGDKLSTKKQREKVGSCMVLNAIKTVFEDKNVAAKTFGRRKTKIWQNISEAVNSLDTERYLFKLPGAWRRLKAKYEEYLKVGYPLFIHKGEGNINKLLITGEIADFILAQYCLPNKPRIPEVWAEYELERELHENWGVVTEEAIKNWLNKPEQRRIWVLARHGKEEWEKEFKHTLKRKKINWFPNCYWAIDGTKLDWIHLWDNSSNKLGAQLKIDVMFDVYSEKILGYSLSFSEAHTDHFIAIKQAIQTAECRPYLLTYDQQSGHKSKRMQEFYSSLVAADGGTHYMHRSRAHNSPAEQLFNRLQQQVINRFWFSDGQSITVRRSDNKHNQDFIDDNKHLIKTTEELERAWAVAVKLWNESKHPHQNKTRNEVYKEQMPKSEPLSMLDIAEKMWINQTKPITYRAHGLDMWVGDKKYQFEVYNADGSIDLEFRRKYIGRKFIVRYDPEFLNEFVELLTMDYDAELVHVATAQPKREHEVVPSLMQPGDKEQWQEDYKVRDIEYERDLNDYKALLQRTGITPEKMIEDQEYLIKTAHRRPKEERSKIESTENALARL